MKIERFEDSLAWQKAKELCIEIYLLFDKKAMISVLKTKSKEQLL